MRECRASMRQLLALLVLLVLNHAALVGTRISVSIMSLKEFGFSPALNGTLMALFGLVPAVLAIGTGRLVDRIGFYKPMLAGALVLLGGVTLLVVLPDRLTLFAGAPLVTGGFMLYQIALQHAFGQVGDPADRTVNFSWLSFGFSLSGLFGPVFAGFGIDTIGYRATFGMFALFSLVPVIALLGGKVPLPAHAPAGKPAQRQHFLDLLADRRIAFVYLVTGLTAIAWDLFVFFVPIYGASIGLSASRIGVILGVFAAATVVVRLAMPFLAHRVTPHQIVLTALALGGLAYVAFPLVESLALLMVVAAVLGVALGTSQPMVMALLYSGSPPGRVGEALGLRQTIVNSAQTAAPLFFGLAGAAVGMLPVCWLVALTLLGGVWTLRGRLKL